MKAQQVLVIVLILAGLAAFAFLAWQIEWKNLGTHSAFFGRPRATARNGQLAVQGESMVDETSPTPEQQDVFDARRAQMVQHQLAARDINDKRVLDVMRRVPRHEFVPPRLVDQAYLDGPLPIGHQQTISQPYIVALMTQLARTQPDAVALDIGTGSGYQAAILSLLCKKVHSIEIVEPLAKSARERLARLGHENVTVRCGDGYRGWPEHAPFDVIIVAAAPDHVPQPLIDQLKEGGRLVIPVGKSAQTLRVIEKRADGTVHRKNVVPVAFVPMTGEAEKTKKTK